MPSDSPLAIGENNSPFEKGGKGGFKILLLKINLKTNLVNHYRSLILILPHVEVSLGFVSFTGNIF
jgi:hypothetical protein